MDTPNTETLDTLSDRVIRLAADQVGSSPEQISLDSRFVEDLGFDSLNFVEFTMEIEDQFNISVSDDVIQRIFTVRQAVDEIRKLIDSQNRSQE